MAEISCGLTWAIRLIGVLVGILSGFLWFGIGSSVLIEVMMMDCILRRCSGYRSFSIAS